MTTLNSFVTLAEFKDFFASRGGQPLQTDPVNDAVLELLLKGASEYIENETQRHFTPYIQTRYFDVPGTDEVDPRVLEMDDDLLEVLSITNGDGVTIPSTEYTLRPRNQSPYQHVRLTDNSTFYWASDGAGDTHDVIAVSGIWGYHNRYASAWQLGSTAAEAMDASETAYTVANGNSFRVGSLIRFDNELGYVSSISTNDLTTTRGENGSTAAAHETSINIYVWQTMTAAKQAVLEIANQAKARRVGQSLNNVETITPGGISISPRDIPKVAADFISAHRRYT